MMSYSDVSRTACGARPGSPTLAPAAWESIPTGTGMQVLEVTFCYCSCTIGSHGTPQQYQLLFKNLKSSSDVHCQSGAQYSHQMAPKRSFFSVDLQLNLWFTLQVLVPAVAPAQRPIVDPELTPSLKSSPLWTLWSPAVTSRLSSPSIPTPRCSCTPMATPGLLSRTRLNW